MTTTSPGSFDPLTAVEELHATVRKWTEHIPQNIPYVDLMFAFGFATLGDRKRAEALVEAARKVMQVPIPTQPTRPVPEKQADPFVAAIVTNFLFKAFKYRVDQAVARKPHAGPLSEELTAELDAIRTKAHAGSVSNPYLFGEYVIDMIRVPSRILEPDERINPYSYWTKNKDPLDRALSELNLIRDPEALTASIRNLIRDSAATKSPREAQFKVLQVAIPLAPRVGHEFAIELLQKLPNTLAETPNYDHRQETFQLRQRGELVAQCLPLASRYDRRDVASELVEALLRLANTRRVETRVELINPAAVDCFRVLKQFGLRDQIERLLALLEEQVPGGIPVPDRRPKRSKDLNQWMTELQTLLRLAVGYTTLGFNHRAVPILDAARHELVTAYPVRADPRDTAALARAYLEALGTNPMEQDLGRILAFFHEIPATKITNTWTMAQYYSRFHLNLVEDAVFAVCRMDFAPPHVVSA